MTENRMYSQRTHNICVCRGCSFGCVYCSFKRLVQMNRMCPDCAEFKPHSHMEVLQRKPPRTKAGEFLTVGLAGDVAFMGWHDFCDVLTYCEKWNDRTFLIQSKNPEYFLQFKTIIPKNVILGTTIECDWIEFENNNEFPHYDYISDAPYPNERYEAVMKLNCRKAVTVEPILDFSVIRFFHVINNIAPEFVYIGYCNDGKQGNRLKLPEPPMAKTQELIAQLREAGIDVREKSIRKAWWEQ